MLNTDFISRCNNKHNSKYNYSKTNYLNQKTKIIIICPTHGEFTQRASAHLYGQGCPKCALLSPNRYNKNISNSDYFIALSRSIHGDKYNYSKVVYKNTYSKIIITCPKHGDFTQRASAHTHGKQGCKKCSIEKSRSNNQLFIGSAIKIHGDQYNYSKINYIDVHTPIIIICEKHGDFQQTPISHLSGHGCQQCAYEIDKTINLSTTSDFLIKSEQIHKDEYLYLKTKYTHSKSPVTITCKIHGDFQQKPNYHLCGNGCPKCAGTHLQNEIYNFIKEHEEVVFNDRETIKPYELDILVPKFKIAVEIHGLYWHSYNKKESTSEIQKHCFKHNLCIAKDIFLLQFTEYDWLYKQEIIKSMILNKLGRSIKIYARKCELYRPTKIEYDEFMKQNHIQGAKNASYIIGLKFNKILTSIMSFNIHNQYNWEITRLATIKNHVVIGGAGKLLNQFVKDKHPKTLMTYANKFYSTGEVYKKLGFILIKNTYPNYFYIKRGRVFSRQQFQKHKLQNKLLLFDNNLTEYENMFNNKYRRFWDAGNYKFLKTF